MAHSRRAFLKALGVGPALLPLFEAERALAACGGVSGPKRAFILVWAGGMFATNGSSWATAGDNFVLPVHMAALEKHRADLLLLDGLDYSFLLDSPPESVPERTGHATFQGMLTGALYQGHAAGTASAIAGGPSIDQHIGAAFVSNGYGGLASLNLAVCAKSTARLSWRSAGDPVIPNQDPFKAFATLFTGSASAADKKARMRQSVLDYVSKDLSRFAKKIGGKADRANVDAHLQSVRELEQRLAQAVGVGGTACAPPTLVPLETGSVTSTTNFERVAQLQIDLAVAALAADATRVVVLQLGDQHNSGIILSSLGFVATGMQNNSGDLNSLMNINHANGADKIKCDGWFMSQVAYVIERLKNVTDGAGSMLDSTAFLTMNNMRTGGDEYWGVPAILAGNCGGYFKTGRSLTLPTGTANNGVLIALANAVGVPTETFGEARYGGELSVLRS
jgi:Protein of unknown function (DUF1552)